MSEVRAHYPRVYSATFYRNSANFNFKNNLSAVEPSSEGTVKFNQSSQEDLFTNNTVHNKPVSDGELLVDTEAVRVSGMVCMAPLANLDSVW